MTDDRIQINKKVLLELGSYMRDVIPRFGSGNFHRITYEFDNTFLRYDIYSSNNIMIQYNKLIIYTSYDDTTKEYYLTDVDYVKFEHFLSNVPFRPKYPHFNTLVQYFRQLVDSPMIKAARSS